MSACMHYTGSCSSLLHNSDHTGSSDNCGINVNWQLTELYVFTYSIEHLLDVYVFGRKWLHLCSVKLCF